MRRRHEADTQMRHVFTVFTATFNRAHVLHRVGDRFPRRITDSDPLEVQYRLKVRGEKWGFQRTAVMREYPFPEPDRKLSHVPESIVWNRIARSTGPAS